MELWTRHYTDITTTYSIDRIKRTAELSIIRKDKPTQVEDVSRQLITDLLTPDMLKARGFRREDETQLLSDVL